MDATKLETAPWLRRYDTIIGIMLALAALGVYSLTLAPTVLEADAGEFQFVPWLPGIAHPTGYPLYTMVGWVWAHLLPVGEVAWRMNLLSALFAAITIGLVYGLACCLLEVALPGLRPGLRSLGAALAALTLAFTSTFWSQALVAEVYTLHTLFVAAILWLALKSAYTPTRGAMLGLALVFGLGLVHHRTTILLAPALLLFFGAVWVVRGETSARFSLKHAFYLLLPLLLYLYLPLAAPLTPYATLSLSEAQTLVLYENSLRGFWQHVAGTVFAGEIQPTAVGFERFILIWQLLRQQVGWVGAILALAGIWVLWRQRKYDLLLLTGVLFLTIIGFNIIYFIGDVFVLFIPAWLVLCLWLALGSVGLANGVATHLVHRKMSAGDELLFEQMRERLQQGLSRLAAQGLMLFFFAIPLVLLLTRYSVLDQSHNTAAQTRWQAILEEPLPASAVLLSNDRNEIMPLWYYQYVEGRRTDLLGLFPLIVPGPAFANIGRVMDQALASGRPVYLVKPMEPLTLKANITPENGLFRVTAVYTPPTYLTNAAFTGEDATDRIVLSGYELSSPTVTAGDELSLTLHWQVVDPLSRNYTTYIHLVGPDGRTLTQSDHRPGDDFYPSRNWQVGETLRDRHLLTIPAATPPGVYQLQVGLYDQPEPGVIQGLGDATPVGWIAIKEPDAIVTVPPGHLPYVTEINFGEAITLLGYDIVPVDDNQLLLNLVWQAKQSPTINWTVFVHLLDDEDNLIAQQDGQPRGGSYPTTIWDIDEVVTDPHVLTLPESLPEGEYRLALGLYHPETGERLPITNTQGEAVGDSLKVKITL
jgi:hypothetical protein